MTAAGDREPLEAELVPAAVGLATPGAILTRLRAVDADVWSLDVELQAQRAQVGASFLRGWEHWREAWVRFRRENEPLTPRLWPGTLAEVESFARRLRDWRTAAERAGARFTTPAPARVPAPQSILPQLPALPLPNLDPSRLLRPMLGPAGELLRPSGGPLSADFWRQVKPVAIAGAVVVAGVGLIWAATMARAALSQAKSAERVIDQAAPLLLRMGV